MCCYFGLFGTCQSWSIFCNCKMWLLKGSVAYWECACLFFSTWLFILHKDGDLGLETQLLRAKCLTSRFYFYKCCQSDNIWQVVKECVPLYILLSSTQKIYLKTLKTEDSNLVCSNSRFIRNGDIFFLQKGWNISGDEYFLLCTYEMLKSTEHGLCHIGLCC